MYSRFLLLLTTLFFIPQNVYAMSVSEYVDKYFAPFSDAFSNIVFTPVKICGISVPVIIMFLFHFL